MSKSDDVVAESLTTDCAFDLLRNETRRRVLAVLRGTDDPMVLDELAGAVAARDDGVTHVEGVTSDEGVAHDESVTHDEDEVSAEDVSRNEDAPPAEASDDRREHIAASLHHCHLPKLEDAGVVTYDPITATVKPTPLVEELTTYVEKIRVEVGHLDA